MKRQNQLNIKRGLLSKLVLLVALFLGSSNAWGETTIVNGKTIASGWETIKTSISGYTPSSVFPYNTDNDDYLYPASNYNWNYLHTTSGITIKAGQTLLFNAGNNDGYSSPEIKIRYSTDNSTWTVLNEYTKTTIKTDGTWGKIETAEISSDGTYYFQIFSKGVRIKSIDITDAPLPPLSLTPEGDISFGNKSENATVSITAKNNTESSFNVVPTIGGSNPGSFSVLNTAGTAEIGNEGIAILGGNSYTFTISFNYDSSSLGEKTATITFTPNEDAEEAITINASATAILDAPLFELSYEGEKDAAFGEVTTNASKTYTVRNAGTQPMAVNISLSGASSYYSLSSEDFTENTTNIENIEAGESKEFTVTFNYPSPLTIDELTERTATITVTPTYNVELAETIDATATVVTDVVWDEAKATTWGTGYNNILVKIQPQSGWNTCILPASSSNCIPEIFGPCTIYQLDSYSDDGVLSFAKFTGMYLGPNVPCLVYVESAPDNSKGVLLKNTYINIASSDPLGTSGLKTNDVGGSAIFKGTFAPIGAGGLVGKYGITSESKLAKGNKSASIKGFRAYLEVSGAAPARIMTIDSEGETTDLGFVRMVDQEAKDIYNLQGQKVEKGRKGIYIVNGKKVVIK